MKAMISLLIFVSTLAMAKDKCPILIRPNAFQHAKLNANILETLLKEHEGYLPTTDQEAFTNNYLNGSTEGYSFILEEVHFPATSRKSEQYALQVSEFVFNKVENKRDFMISKRKNISKRSQLGFAEDFIKSTMGSCTSLITSALNSWAH